MGTGSLASTWSARRGDTRCSRRCPGTNNYDPARRLCGTADSWDRAAESGQGGGRTLRRGMTATERRMKDVSWRETIPQEETPVEHVISDLVGRFECGR